jgi:hypothetical protein
MGFKIVGTIKNKTSLQTFITSDFSMLFSQQSSGLQNGLTCQK